MRFVRPPRPLAAIAAALLALAALLPSPPAPAQEAEPEKPPAPAPPAKEDADLPPAAEILKEARSDPRNLKPDAFSVIRSPAYTGVLDAKRMDPDEWVVGVVIGKTALAFPVNVLNAHEILVDEAEGVPFLVCWCPLCRTGVVHDRRLGGEVLDFGHSGLLFRSSFLLYDLKTRSYWHHVKGRALTGPMRGRRLAPLPSRFVRFGAWRAAYPATKVLAKDPSNLDQTVDSFEPRNKLLKLQWGLGIEAGGEDRLFEIGQLERMPLVQDVLGGVPVVVAYQPARQLAVAWERTVDGKVLDLRRGADAPHGLPRLEETGEDPSVFDLVSGVCVSGPLKDKSLPPVRQCWWEVYAWTAHHPIGTMFRASVPPPGDLPAVPK